MNRVDSPAASPLAGCWAALVVAVAGLAGSLYLSMGMKLRACPLCFYQRTFVMSIIAVLAMGLLARAVRPGRLALLALPLAVAGLSVALFHVFLELTGKLECPPGILDVGTAPQQSLALYLLLTLLIGADAVRGGAEARAALAGSLVLGALLGWLATLGNPPPPPAPTQPYPEAPVICRPPHVPLHVPPPAEEMTIK